LFTYPKASAVSDNDSKTLLIFANNIRF
jgi:hypothetical protein